MKRFLVFLLCLATVLALFTSCDTRRRNSYSGDETETVEAKKKKNDSEERTSDDRGDSGKTEYDNSDLIGTWKGTVEDVFSSLSMLLSNDVGDLLDYNSDNQKSRIEFIKEATKLFERYPAPVLTLSFQENGKVFYHCDISSFLKQFENDFQEDFSELMEKLLSKKGTSLKAALAKVSCSNIEEYLILHKISPEEVRKVVAVRDQTYYWKTKDGFLYLKDTKEDLAKENNGVEYRISGKELTLVSDEGEVNFRKEA